MICFIFKPKSAHTTKHCCTRALVCPLAQWYFSLTSSVSYVSFSLVCLCVCEFVCWMRFLLSTRIFRHFRSHVGLTNSCQWTSPKPATATQPFDPFHALNIEVIACDTLSILLRFYLSHSKCCSMYRCICCVHVIYCARHQYSTEFPWPYPKHCICFTFDHKTYCYFNFFVLFFVFFCFGSAMFLCESSVSRKRRRRSRKNQPRTKHKKKREFFWRQR